MTTVETQTEESLRQLARVVRALLPSDENHDDQKNKFIDSFRSVLNACYLQSSQSFQIAAWNALCAFIDQLAASSVPEALWEQTIWADALSLYLSRATDVRPKSAKQVLVSLTGALKKASPCSALSECRHLTLQRLAQTLLQHETGWKLRPSLMLISNLLSKDAFTLEELDASLREEQEHQPVRDLLQVCLDLMSLRDSVTSTAALIAVVIDRLDLGSRARWTDMLLASMRRHADYLEHYRVYLLPLIIKKEPSMLQKALQQCDWSDDLRASNYFSRALTSNHNIVIVLLQVGKDLGLVVESDQHSIAAEHIALSAATLKGLMQHSDRAARKAGLSLLLDSPSSTKPLSDASLSLLKSSLPFLHADTDANFRSELFAVLQRFIDRVRGAMAAQDRHRMLEAVQCLSCHKSFLLWYIKFLRWELRPGTSYQRHICALRILSILLRSGIDQSIPEAFLAKSSQAIPSWPFNLCTLDAGLERLLVDLLVDSFDDVRSNAADLIRLRLQSSSNLATSNLASLQAMLSLAKIRAERDMLDSGRADQADGVAHINSLLCSALSTNEERQHYVQELLERTHAMIEIAESSLASAVHGHPLHGQITSIRYTLSRALPVSISDQNTKSIITSLQAVWELVKDTLCNDAPEGFVPEDMDEDDGITTKDILSYCWRALKEASLLTGFMVTLLSKSSKPDATQMLSQLIELTFTQLAELRHRGAFSTVSQTWVSCCAVVQSRDDLGTLQDLIPRITQLIKQATINTRRSAGLPSLICGVLAADTTLVPGCFAQLSAIARQPVRSELDDESSLPQVHALNCIKDMLKSTRLAAESEALTASALELAADSLQSSAWAVRNCGLMLFRAVLDRLVGSNDSFADDVDVKNAVSFDNQPLLLKVVLDLITIPHTPIIGDGTRYDGVFPALQLLQHAKMSKAQTSTVEPALCKLLAVPSWLVRDKAARTLATLLDFDRVVQLVTMRIGGQVGNNALHGDLLVLKHAIKRVRRGSATLEGKASQAVGELVQRVTLESSCPTILALADELKSQATATSISPADMAPRAIACADVSATQAMLAVSSSTEADDWLRVRSSLLESEALSGHVSPIELSDLITCCETVRSEDSLFSTEAIAHALQTFEHTLTKLNEAADGKAVIQRLILLIYDLLNDDDEAVRISAAKAASRIASLQDQNGICLEPFAAAQMLLVQLIRQRSGCTEFADIALERAFQYASSAGPRQLLARAMQKDRSLFAEEKQNLYIDDVLEAKAWSRVAMRLAPTSLDTQNVLHLAEFAQEGIESLLEVAALESDGPLGWTTSPEVFVFGLRIIYAAETLIKLSEGGVRLPVKPSTIRDRLVMLMAQLRQTDGHVLWLDELERISTLAVTRNAQNIGSLIDLVVRRLDGET